MVRLKYIKFDFIDSVCGAAQFQIHGIIWLPFQFNEKPTTRSWFAAPMFIVIADDHECYKLAELIHSMGFNELNKNETKCKLCYIINT